MLNFNSKVNGIHYGTKQFVFGDFVCLTMTLTPDLDDCMHVSKLASKTQSLYRKPHTL